MMMVWFGLVESGLLFGTVLGGLTVWWLGRCRALIPAVKGRRIRKGDSSWWFGR